MNDREISDLPMFPLGQVILPGSVVPLHVFEERYRALVRVCMRSDRRFGTVLISRGAEVGGGDSRTAVGCLLTIERAAELEDGRWYLVASARERIRVAAWLDDDPFPRARIRMCSDDDEANRIDPASWSARLAELDGRIRALVAAEVEWGATRDVLGVLPIPTERSALAATLWELVARLSPTALDAQALLECDDPETRLRLFASAVRERELVNELLRANPAPADPADPIDPGA